MTGPTPKPNPEPDDDDLPLTQHARRRMKERGISREAVELALRFGRIVWTRGAQIFAIGHREVADLQEQGLDLSRHEGVQVVCSPAGTILTVYRNRSFRSLRRRLGRRRPPRRPRFCSPLGTFLT